MQTTCRHCQHTIEFTGQRPIVCAACGRSLAAPADDDTLDYLPARDSDEMIAGAQANLHAAAGDRVGDYRLLRPIGQGGMGVVWEAEHPGTGRRVALKLLSPRLNHTAENVDRFLREGKLAASLSHPRSTFVFGAGEHHGQPYIAMELMSGRTLKDVLDEEGPLPVERAVDYILDVIGGLEAAHALGVIHRDVKPSNCFLDGDGRIKIGDFGLSKSLVSDAELTRTGAFLGTPQFAAPEQVRGAAVDRRTDVYSVGATLFSLLAGRAPFEGDAAAVIAKIISEPPPRLSSLRPDVRHTLERIVDRALEKDPARRFKDLAALRRALAPLATGGVSMADLGRRFAAYMLDWLLLRSGTSLIAFGITTSLQWGANWPIGTTHVGSPVIDARMALFQEVAALLYFALAEGRWGCGLGKRLLGLRVIGPDGERPGYGRALWRTLILPGALGLGFILPLVVLLGPRPESTTSRTLAVIFRVAGGNPGEAWLASLLPTLVMLLFLTRMSARNGYRGLHEFASGTRVVRVRTSVEGRFENLPCIMPIAKWMSNERFGPYEPVGQLGDSRERAVVQARDELLGRTVWIYVGPNDACMGDRRRLLARPARPHWLQSGEGSLGHWDAFEAVAGLRLIEIARQAAGTPWEESRAWLLALCDELRAAVEDGTLPEALSADQVWIARGGHVKLLDAPLDREDPREVEGPVIHTGAPAERAVGLLRDVARLCMRDQVAPVRVRQFADELALRPASEETLAWAATQLREAAKRPATLGSFDRLGTLAVSIGSELPVYVGAAAVLPVLFIVLFQRPINESAAMAWLALLLPALLGFLFQGGPAFWLTHTDILRSDGRRASRWRCAWRSFVAWTPLLVFFSFLGMFVASSFTTTPTKEGQGRGTHTFSLSPETWWAPIGMCGGELLIAIFLLGALYAVLRPRRGWQDLLSGTWLTPQ